MHNRLTNKVSTSSKHRPHNQCVPNVYIDVRCCAETYFKVDACL